MEDKDNPDPLSPTADENTFLSPQSPVPSNPESPDTSAILEASHEGFSDLSMNDCHSEKASKRRSDEGLELRDELDFEEGEKESGEEGEDSEEDDGQKQTVPINREEGELSEEEEEDPSLRQEPKTVCRFFNKGQCTWGTNCRFLHPGVSDKGNYNMFAPAKVVAPPESQEESPEKERPREIRPFVPEPSPFESAWERGLRHAKEMMKRASKRKETDADFEEKRFNLSLGQAELDRENDYYTRPASPVYKPSDEVIEYLDPYEKQAIRHFRGGHFENFEVRYNIDPAYPNRGNQVRSRREKYDREVTERVARKPRVPSPIPQEEHRIPVKEKRYPRPRPWTDERVEEPPHPVGKGEAELWADPWARRKTPIKRVKKKRKVSRTRSYSSGSSSRSSRSSHSSSYSSYSRSRSRSRSSSRSFRSRSSSRSITPPIHPRQRARGRGAVDRGGRQPGNFGGPGRPFVKSPLSRRPGIPREARDTKEISLIVPKTEPPEVKRVPPSRKPDQKPPPDLFPRSAPLLKKIEPKQTQPEHPERVDMFGRTLRKDVPRSPSRSASPVPRTTARARKYSFSPSRSRSHSRSSFSSRSRSRSRSKSSDSSGMSSPHSAPRPVKKKGERNPKMTKGTVSYGNAPKFKATDVSKTAPAASQKAQLRLTAKKSIAKQAEKPTTIGLDDDSGESDVDARILKKRKAEAMPSLEHLPPLKVKRPSPQVGVAAVAVKKPTGSRREELLKQLRAVEDAIKRKRSKVPL